MRQGKRLVAVLIKEDFVTLLTKKSKLSISQLIHKTLLHLSCMFTTKLRVGRGALCSNSYPEAKKKINKHSDINQYSYKCMRANVHKLRH
jgi:hypothetical protein